MSVQDIIFSASGGSSTTSSIEYAVGVYDLPITANWSAIVYTGEKTVIVGDNKFVTITDPADQSTMVYGDLPANVRATHDKLVCINQTILIPSRTIIDANAIISSLDGGITWSLVDQDYNGAAQTLRWSLTDITPLRNKSYFNARLMAYNTTQQKSYLKNALLDNKTAIKISTTTLDSITTQQTATDYYPGSSDLNQKFIKGFPYLETVNPNISKISYAPGKINGATKYLLLRSNSELWGSSDNQKYTKMSTTLPTGTYLDITFAGGKFCAPIANTNKFVVIG